MRDDRENTSYKILRIPYARRLDSAVESCVCSPTTHFHGQRGQLGLGKTRLNGWIHAGYPTSGAPFRPTSIVRPIFIDDRSSNWCLFPLLSPRACRTRQMVRKIMMETDCAPPVLSTFDSLMSVIVGTYCNAVRCRKVLLCVIRYVGRYVLSVVKLTGDSFEWKREEGRERGNTRERERKGESAIIREIP